MTGASGFIGANLARRLLYDGHDVHLIVRPGFNPWRITDIRESVHLYEIDLRDATRLEQTIHQIAPQWVFHLAVNGAYSWQNNVADIMQTNFQGTVNLVEACLKSGFESLVNTGSSSEYGLKNHAPAETEWMEPNSYYAVSKASATLYCRFAAQHFGVQIPTLRLYSVFGPFEDRKRLLPTVIISGLRQTLPPLVEPEIGRDFVFVDDVVEAYLLAAMTSGKEPGSVYNVGSGIQTTIGQVVDYARQVFGIREMPQWGSLPNRGWDTTQWVANPEKIMKELGWSPRFSFEEGFTHMVDWIRSHPNYQTEGTV
jgi:nucleoside-diphosphate-sugar epimerase